MIVDAFLAIPMLIIATVWNALEVAQAFPNAVHTSAETLGDYLYRLNFIIPIDTFGTVIGWYFVIVSAYFSLWVILMIVNLYKAFKLF